MQQHANSLNEEIRIGFGIKENTLKICLFGNSKKFRAEQEKLKTISQEEFTELRNRYAPLIKPIEFPIEGIRIAYAYEPEWNDEFLLWKRKKVILPYIGLQRLNNRFYNKSTDFLSERTFHKY